MMRLTVLALLAAMIAVPALAQVINGETPLDETRLNRETPGPAAEADRPRPQPPAAESTPAAPEQSESPAARRD